MLRWLREGVPCKCSEHFGHSWLPNSTERKSGEGDAKLNGGQEFIHGMFELQHRPGTGPAGGDELLNTGLPEAYQRELCCDEEAVGQDEEGHHNSPDESPLKHEQMLADAEMPANLGLAGTLRALLMR